MRLKLLAPIAALAFGSPAHAQTTLIPGINQVPAVGCNISSCGPIDKASGGWVPTQFANANGIYCDLQVLQLCWDGPSNTTVAPSSLMSDTRGATEPYDPGNGVTTPVSANTLPLGSGGLQIFKTNTNYLTYSTGAYYASNWSTDNFSIAAPTVVSNAGTSPCPPAVTAPDGSCNTATITLGSSTPSASGSNKNSDVYIATASLTNGTQYTCYSWVKPAPSIAGISDYAPMLALNITSNPANNGIANNTPIVLAPNSGWQRVSVTFTATSTASVYYRIGFKASSSGGTPGAPFYTTPPNGGGTFIVWESQCNLGPDPAPYVSTTSTAATSSALDNIAATNDLASMLAGAQGSLQTTTALAAPETTETILDSNGTVFVGYTSGDFLTSGLAPATTTLPGTFGPPQNGVAGYGGNTCQCTGQATAYFDWSSSGGAIGLNGGGIATYGNSVTPSGTFHFGTVSGNSLPLNGYILNFGVSSTQTAPTAAASLPITGIGTGPTSGPAIYSKQTGLSQGTPPYFCDGDTFYPTEDQNGVFYGAMGDGACGSSFSTQSPANGNAMSFVYTGDLITSTPMQITGGNSNNTTLGVFNTPIACTQPMGSTSCQWKPGGMLAVKDGSNVDLFWAIVRNTYQQQNHNMIQPGHYASIVYSVNPTVSGWSSSNFSWSGLPGSNNGEINSPTFPNLSGNQPPGNSPYYAFTWPTFPQVSPGYDNASVGTPDGAGIQSGNYIYAVGDDQGYGNSTNILLARILADTVLTNLGGTVANIVTASNWQYYDSLNPGCPGSGDGTNANCWVSSAKKATPIATLPLQLGMPSMMYLPGPNRWILTAFNWTPLAGRNAGSISNQTNFSVWGQFVYYDCAHLWGQQPGQCKLIGVQNGWWHSGTNNADGYYSAAFMPPVINSGYSVNVLGAGNYNFAHPLSSSDVYTPTEWQLTLHF